MQQRHSPRAHLVVPVHYHALVVRVHVVVIDIAPRVGHAAQLVLELRVRLLQQVIVLKRHNEHVSTLVDVVHARLPVDRKQVNALDRHVAQAVLRVFVPHHGQHARAALELAPPHLVVGILKPLLLQDDRQDRGQHLRRLPVSLLARKHDRLGIVVHRVSMLVGNVVHQPRAGRLRIARIRALARLLPVPQLVPLLVVHYPVF